MCNILCTNIWRILMQFLENDKILSISEFRKKPIIATNEKAMCILKDNRDAFYCLNRLRYAQLLRAEKRLKEMSK